MGGYDVVAKKWDEGWELHIADWETAEISIAPDLNGLEAEIMQTRAEIQSAAEAQIRATAYSRQVARALRSQGLSVTDTAAVLGVTRSRFRSS
ncbi:MAG: hypothetical protein JJE02_08070 [Propionibacteriales bacterium]|nr:hypothetical protein [Propionibacteriales bacterium]